MTTTPTPLAPVAWAIKVGQADDLAIFRDREAAMRFSVGHHGAPIIPLYALDEDQAARVAGFLAERRGA